MGVILKKVIISEYCIQTIYFVDLKIYFLNTKAEPILFYVKLSLDVLVLTFMLYSLITLDSE